MALGVFVLAALTLYWPLFTGKVIVGSDYYIAGWAFRHFGAEYWRQHHALPVYTLRRAKQVCGPVRRSVASRSRQNASS